MSTKGRLQDDMKSALRAGDKARLSVIRLALAAIKQVEVDERISLDEPGTLAVLQKMVKQRREEKGTIGPVGIADTCTGAADGVGDSL